MIKKISLFIFRVKLLIFMLFSGFAFSQTPGGIVGTDLRIEYWLRADEVSTILPVNGADVTTWEDQSPYGRDFNNELAITYRFYPKFKKSAMNYHSAVDFYYDSSVSSANNNRRKLLSKANFFPEAARSYFTIFVSRLDKTRSNNPAVVFGLNTDTSSGSNGNQVGWNNPTASSSVWSRANGTAVSNGGALGSNYGVSIVVQPNASGVLQEQYLNAFKNTTNIAAQVLRTTASKSVIGTSNISTGYDNNFFGDVMEVVVISIPGSGKTLSVSDLEKINSHYAIKYGFTLNASQKNYVLSDGTSIYNSGSSSYSAYDKNIFGIARDDASGLYQKQSKSTEDDDLAVFLDDLKETNGDNNGVLVDKQAVILGSNGLTGSYVYIHSNSTNFEGVNQLGASDKLSHRTKKVFKAKLTGFGGSVSVNFYSKAGTADWLLVSNDVDFTPSLTKIYRMVNGKATVELTDGDFVSFAYKLDTPGGIIANGLEVEYWLKADEVSDVIPEDGEDILLWEDKSSNGFLFTNTEANPMYPRFKKSAMNFHSAVDFYYQDGVTIQNNRRRKLRSENVFTPDIDNRAYYVAWVSRVDKRYSFQATDPHASVFTLNADTNDGNGNAYGWIGNTASTSGAATVGQWFKTDNRGSTLAQSPIDTREYGIGTAVMPNNGTAIPQQQFLNAVGSTSSVTASSMYATATNSIIGSTIQSNSTNWYYGFNGDIMEVVVMSAPKGDYATTFGGDNMKKINTNLAIKYGVSLNSSGQTDYLLSNGSVIYNSADVAYTSYNKDIFGIARDDDGSLYQKQSKSTDNPSVTVFVDDLKDTNAENTGALINKTALVFGASGTLESNTIYESTVGAVYANGYTIGTHVDPITGSIEIDKFNRRYGYKLKAKVTGMGANPFIVNMAREVSLIEWILVGSDPDFAPGNTRIYKVVNGKAEGLVINDGDFVGFAFYLRTPGGITANNLKMEYWLKADEVSAVLPADGADINSWKDVSSNERNFSNNLLNPYLPKFVKSAMNFHSSVDFYYLLPEDGGPSSGGDNLRRKLISDKTFTVSSTKTYYVAWVSKVYPERSSSYSVVFGLGGSGASSSSNSYGWRVSGDQASVSHYTNGSQYSGALSDAIYGVSLVQLPNSSLATDFQRQYFNGVLTTWPGRQLSTDSSLSTIGSGTTDSNTTNGFMGEVMEVIVMSVEGNNEMLTQADLDQLNTYLAIKYGISMDPTAQKRFLLSDKTTVIFDRDNLDYTNYSKDVFGIARDEEGGLNQRQSASTDNPVLTVYLGELAETNAENTTNLLSDKQALVFGSNGLKGTEVYQHSATSSPAFANKTLVGDERMSHRFSTILKAKLTGFASNAQLDVNVQVGQGEWLLVSSDPSFSPSSTFIYKVEAGSVLGVPIKDKDYISFASFLTAPAGVRDGLVMWLNASKPNSIVKNNANEVLSWVDSSGFGTVFSKINANSTAPIFTEREEKLNFHPGVYFRKSREYLSTRKGAFSVAAPNDYSFITALNVNFNTDRRIYFTSYGSLTRDIYPTLGVYKSTTASLYGRARIYDGGGANAIDGTRELFGAGSTTIVGHTMKKNVGFDFYVDSFTESFSNTRAGRGSRLNGPGTLGYGGASDSRNIIGSMGEHIAYESELSPANREKIDSYLGLKYAITLGRDPVPGSTTNIYFDYKFSDNTPVWAGRTDAINKAFHNNVASIIRDDSSELYNYQSRSTNEGAVVIMGIGTKLGVDPVLGTIDNDLSALTWGNNGASISAVTTTNLSCGDIDEVLGGRVWMAQKTSNFNQEVLVGAYGDDFPFSGPYYQVYLVLADNASKITSNNWDQIIPMNFNNDMHVTNFLFTADRTYFSFVAKRIEGNCETCEFTGIKKLDFTRSNWATRPATISKGPNTYDLGDGFKVTVNVTDPGNKFYYRYPRPSSRNSLRERRRAGNTVKTIVEFKDNEGLPISAATNFELFDIDRQSIRLDDVQVIGYCGGAPVYPKLYYVYSNSSRSTYTINSNAKAIGKGRGVPYNASVGYTNARGRVFVDFEYAVEKIEIVYNTLPTATTSGLVEIGIGAMEFYCPAPLPAPNEDGLIFTKQGPTDVNLCDVVDYTFRVINTNCVEKEVVFSDILPEDMTWINNSFSAGNQDFEDGSITGYGSKTLIATGVKVPGGGGTFVMRASALFKEEAKPLIYENQAFLKYKRLGVDVELGSTDRLTGEATTKTNAKASARPKEVIAKLTLDKSCIKENKEYVVTLNINNPNLVAEFPITDVSLSLNYDETIFDFVQSSISATGFALPTGDDIIIEDGFINLDGITLPSGASSISFKVTAKDISYFYVKATPPNGPIEYEDLSFGFDMYSESALECSDSVLANANGVEDFPYCTWCTQPPVAGQTQASKVGISTMKDQFVGWPENVPNGYLVLESGKRGMVITRTTPAAFEYQDAGVTKTNAQKGMIIYNTLDKCISIFNGTEWKCIERACND